MSGAAALAADQRARLLQATLAACAEHGWAASTVEELVGRAGVSKTTFYELFEDREDCFLATFEAVVEAAAAEIGEAYRSRTGPRERLTAATERFAEIVAGRPGAAQLVVVDSLSLGAAAIPYRAAAAGRFETMLRQSLDEAAGPGAVGELTIRAWVGGVRRIVYRALREGRPQRLALHVGDLVEWAMGYARAGRSAARPGVVPVRAASGADGGGLGWEAPPGGAAARATLGQRERIVRAAAIATTERGYRDATVGEISSLAGVSKESFYRHFECKLAAFLAAYDALSAHALATAARAFGAAPSWPRGVAAGIEALLAHTAADRLYARLSFFELPTAGPHALDRADLAMEAFTAYLAPARFGTRTRRDPPEVVVEAIGGGIWSAIQHEIAAGRAESLPALAPELVAVALTPFGQAA